MTNGPDTEPIRRLGAAVTMWGGWAYTVGILIFSVIDYDPNHGNFAPQWVGLTFILSIGLAIAGTLARSRMRLTDTIMAAFKAGAKIRAEQEANSAARESSSSIREEAQMQREINAAEREVREEQRRKDQGM